MGGFAARKALEVVKHVEQVLAIELLAACQALEFHRPTKTTAPLEDVYQLVRTVVKYVATGILLGPQFFAHYYSQMPIILFIDSNSHDGGLNSREKDGTSFKN